MNLPRQTLALLAAMLTGILVGATMVAIRDVAHDIGPGSQAFLRYSVAYLCVLPFLLRAKDVHIARKDLIPVTLIGVTQFAVVVFLLNFGLQYMSAARAALIFASFPLLTMLVAVAMKREEFTRAKAIGVGLTIIGVGLTIGEGLSSAAGENELLGGLAVLASALCGAICSVLYRPYLARSSMLAIGSLSMAASVGLLLLLAIGEGLFADFNAIIAKTWEAVLFIGVSSAVGYMCWLWALRHTDPTRVSIFLSLSPVTATFLGYLLLGETISISTAIGIVTIILGLWVATRTPKILSGKLNTNLAE